AGTGTVDITLTKPVGTSTTTNADRYSYVSPPTVSAVSPSGGSPAGGSFVTIAGTGLETVESVHFGTSKASIHERVSATETVVVAPAHAAGTVDVTATGPGGTSGAKSNDRYTYLEAPTLTDLSPRIGPVSGGN